MSNTCVCCGTTIPEGRQVCPVCESKAELLRCKDCEHWKNVLPDCTEHKRFCEIGFYMIEATGYCSFAKRKQNFGITEQTQAALEAIGRKAHGED